MASLIKRKLLTGIGWRIDYRIDGQHRSEYLPPGTSQVIARQWQTKIEERLIESKLNGVPYASPLKHKDQIKSESVSFPEFTDKYLELSNATKSENTFSLDKYGLKMFLAYLKDQGSDLSMRSITYQEAQDYAVRRLSSVKPVSVNIETRQLKAAFQQAVKWGMIEANPFREVKQLKIKNDDFPRFFSKDEIKKLLAVMLADRFKDLILFYLYTGCRRDEALHLTWDDIDLDRSMVSFRRTKTGVSRAVPLNREIKGILGRMDRDGKPFPFTRWHVTHRFKKYLRKAGLDPSLHLHSLRHTFASHLIMGGVDLPTVSKLLGHSSTRTTEIYAHLAPDHLKAATEKLSF